MGVCLFDPDLIPQSVSWVDERWRRNNKRPATRVHSRLGAEVESEEYTRAQISEVNQKLITTLTFHGQSLPGPSLRILLVRTWQPAQTIRFRLATVDECDDRTAPGQGHPEFDIADSGPSQNVGNVGGAYAYGVVVMAISRSITQFQYYKPAESSGTSLDHKQLAAGGNSKVSSCCIRQEMRQQKALRDFSTWRAYYAGFAMQRNSRGNSCREMAYSRGTIARLVENDSLSWSSPSRDASLAVIQGIQPCPPNVGLWEPQQLPGLTRFYTQLNSRITIRFSYLSAMIDPMSFRCDYRAEFSATPSMENRSRKSPEGKVPANDE
ncbi:hypothetical protein BGW80DRAFT_1444068 [Lactifluus volemus]|nr:hypothetical protein BGW80DRAFT_1444068 [Lactifluus volemus]